MVNLITIGFGLRNLPDVNEGIQEMFRVLKDGGQLLILEFSPVQRGLLGCLYRFQLKYLVPFFGGLISGSRDAYEYLATSIPNFLIPEKVLKVMEEKGFSSLDAVPLHGEIAYIYKGKK